MRKQKILDNFLLSVTLIHLYKLHGHWFQFVNNLSPINFMYVLSFFFRLEGRKKKSTSYNYFTLWLRRSDSTIRSLALRNSKSNILFAFYFQTKFLKKYYKRKALIDIFMN